MTRNVFLFYIIGVPAIAGFIAIELEKYIGFNFFDYNISKFLIIAVYIPIISFLRNRFLKKTLKDNYISWFSLKGRISQFRKP